MTMKKTKRLILHIGTIKTGSTSIQNSLGNSREVLLTHNIYYPKNRPYNHIFRFVPIFLEDPEVSFVFKKELLENENKQLKIEKYRKMWVKEFHACKQDNFIISAEDLTLPFFSEKAIRNLKEFIEKFFDAITIIVYFRHFDTWIPSQAQQGVKMGKTKYIDRAIDKYLNDSHIFSYKNILNNWIKAFGMKNMVVRPFDPKVFYKGSLLDDFFHSCNLSVDDGSIPEFRSNESLGKYAIAFLQKYNQVYPRLVDGKFNLNRGTKRERIPVDLYNDLPDEKFKLEMIYSPKQARRLNQEIDYVNQFFTDGYQFPHVSSGTGEMVFPTSDDIPIEFFVELINNYNKRIESLKQRNAAFLDKNTFLRKRNKKLRQKKGGT